MAAESRGTFATSLIALRRSASDELTIVMAKRACNNHFAVNLSVFVLFGSVQRFPRLSLLFGTRIPGPSNLGQEVCLAGDLFHGVVVMRGHLWSNVSPGRTKSTGATPTFHQLYIVTAFGPPVPIRLTQHFCTNKSRLSNGHNHMRRKIGGIFRGKGFGS